MQNYNKCLNVCGWEETVEGNKDYPLYFHGVNLQIKMERETTVKCLHSNSIHV